MKRVIGLMLLVAVGVGFAGCTQTRQVASPLQKRQITTRTFDGGYEDIFRSTMTVLQDNEYIIKDADMKTGLITAEVTRQASRRDIFMQQFFNEGRVTNSGSKIELSAIVNQLNKEASEVRITIQEKVFGEYGRVRRTVQLYDPRVYNSIFNSIRTEVKRREALRR